MRKHFVKKYSVAICDYRALTNYVSGKYKIPLSPLHSYRGQFFARDSYFFVSVFCGKNFYIEFNFPYGEIFFNYFVFNQLKKSGKKKNIYKRLLLSRCSTLRKPKVPVNIRRVLMDKGGTILRRQGFYLFFAVLFKIIYWAIASQILRPSFVPSDFGRIRSMLIYIIYIN